MNRKSSQKEINEAKKRALKGDVDDLNNIDSVSSALAASSRIKIEGLMLLQ